jgi:hypothetical protein
VPNRRTSPVSRKPALLGTRKKEEEVEGGRDTTFKGVGARNIFSSVLKVPRQCPFVLLIEVCLREGEALASE